MQLRWAINDLCESTQGAPLFVNLMHENCILKTIWLVRLRAIHAEGTVSTRFVGIAFFLASFSFVFVQFRSVLETPAVNAVRLQVFGARCTQQTTVQ